MSITKTSASAKKARAHASDDSSLPKSKRFQTDSLSSSNSKPKKHRFERVSSKQGKSKSIDSSMQCHDLNKDNDQEATMSSNELSVSQQRKALKFKKLMQRNPAAEFVTECNALYARLIDSKDCSVEEKHTKVQQCLDFIDGFDVAGSSSDAFAGKARLLSVNRCLQMCYKYGTAEHRRFMTERLEPHFVKLSCTDTASFLCIKMLKYSDLDTQVSLATLLIAQPTINVAFTKCGSKVIAYALALPKPFPGESLLRKLVLRLCIPRVITLTVPDLDEKAPFQVYTSTDSRGKVQIKEHLDSVINRCVDKELVDRAYFHDVFELYAKVASQEELVSLSSTLADCLLLLFSSRPGCWTICRLIDVMDAKSRKKFIQSWKQAKISSFDLAINEVSFIVLLKLLSTVDDTKLLRESVLGPALGLDAKNSLPAANSDFSKLLELCHSRVGRKILLLLLAENSTAYLTKGEKIILAAKSATSKKDTETRRRELLPTVLNILGAFFSTITSTTLVHDWMQQQGYRDVFVQYVKNTKDAAVVDTLLEALKDPSAVAEIFDHQTAQRTLILLLRIGTSLRPNDPTASSPTVNVAELLTASDGQPLVQHLWKSMQSVTLLTQVIGTRGVFVLADLVTIVKFASLCPLADLENFSQRCGSILQKQFAKEAPGVKLLSGRLTEILAH